MTNVVFCEIAVGVLVFLVVFLIYWVNHLGHCAFSLQERYIELRERVNTIESQMTAAGSTAAETSGMVREIHTDVRAFAQALPAAIASAVNGSLGSLNDTNLTVAGLEELRSSVGGGGSGMAGGFELVGYGPGGGGGGSSPSGGGGGGYYAAGSFLHGVTEEELSALARASSINTNPDPSVPAPILDPGRPVRHN